MEERLITRFKWGLLTELEMPDEELRKNILKSKIHRDGLHIPEDVIEFIATNVTDSVRNLEGVINSLMAYSVVYNCDIDLNLAQKVLRNAIKIEHAPLTVDLILRKTCEHFNVSQDDVFSATRKKAIVQVRQIAMYLAQKHTKLSTSAIGAEIGKRDHATVLHSITAVESHICTDKKFKAEVEAIDASLTNKTSK
jgi:chromosomal replication initiator protein